MDKLLPCPFCGGEAKLVQRKFKYGFYPSGGTYYVHCKSCLITTQPRRKSEDVIAVWNRRVDARQLALKTRICPMCEDCPDGCPVETPKDSRNIVTNADRIRSMSDEELARFLGDEPPYFSTYEKYLDWLQQPAKEE
jgi:Lar family restriction alleviation protein